MKVTDAVAFGAEQIDQTTAARSSARRLLAHVLAVDVSHLLAHEEQRLTVAEIDAYFRLVARRARHEPLPYLLRQVPFRHLDFEVTPAALIPRPETEQLVEQALSWIGGRQGLRCVDVGAGSGCIAISLAHEAPGNAILATEISAVALALAQRNAARHNVDIDLRLGSLLQPLDEQVDLIVANLPYVAIDEWDQVDDAVKAFEPRLALDGGADGLDLIGPLLQQATTRLRPGGAIFLEIGWRQRAACLALAVGHFPAAQIRCHTDYAGNDRIISIVSAAPDR